MATVNRVFDFSLHAHGRTVRIQVLEQGARKKEKREACKVGSSHRYVRVVEAYCTRSA